MEKTKTKVIHGLVFVIGYLEPSYFFHYKTDFMLIMTFLMLVLLLFGNRMFSEARG